MGQAVARRQFVRSLATTAAALSAPLADAQVPEARLTKPQDGDGFIIREMEPQNIESPASAFSTFLTSTERFYVRSHFKQPELSSANWSLNVDGAVSTPLHINYADLLAMAPKTLVSMLECAGNGRVYLVPKADGAQWASGGMGNAE